MISYPKLKNGSVYRQVIDKFKGYNHNLRIGSGEFCEMENLTSDDYPVLSVRKKRGTLNQSLSASKGMYYVPGTGLFYTTREDSVLVLYLMESNHKVTKITTLSDGEKQFALMGSD